MDQRKPYHTLAGHSAVESVSLNKEGFASTLSMGFQHIDCFDGVLDISSCVNRPYGHHRIDGHGSKEVIIADSRFSTTRRIRESRQRTFQLSCLTYLSLLH